MKKLLSLILTLAMGGSFSVTAFAAAPKALDFPLSYIPEYCNGCAVLSVDTDGKLYVAEGYSEDGERTTDFSAIHPYGKPPAGTHMPNREPGMFLVYDSGNTLMKITNADHSLYYFPGDEDTPAEYRGSTWFVVGPDSDPAQEGEEFLIDSPDGMENAQKWIEAHVKSEMQKNILNSLQAQRGTQCTIYLEWGAK